MSNGLHRDSWEDWVFLTRNGIFTSTVSGLSIQHMRDGKGAPTVEDMKRFTKEAAAIVELWEETLPQ